MIEALIFDFDGLILDTEYPEFQAWQEIYQRHQIELPLAQWAVCVGSSGIYFDPYDYLMAQVGESLDKAAIFLQRERRYAELMAEQCILPGVRAYITDAKRSGLKLGLASSSPYSWIRDHCLRFGLNLQSFDCIKSADDVTNIKPDPELFQAVLDELDLLPDQVVVLEDSPNGITAAKRAGLFCVAVPNPLTRLLSLDEADIQLASLADMPLKELLLMVEKKLIAS